MAKASIAKQLTVETKNKVGMLAEVAGVIAAAGANIMAICAYHKEGKACFYVLTNNNAKAKKSLEQKGHTVKEEDIVSVMLEDKVGQAQAIAEKIKAAGVDLSYIYGSTCGCADTQALLVIGSKENIKVVSAING